MLIPEKITEISRKLRKSMTKAEIELWGYLKDRKLGVKFMRQKPICVFVESDGFERFIIADFYCASNNLIVELDGGIHNLKEIYELDKEKEKLLFLKGIKVIRFKNEEIFSGIDKVLENIKDKF